MSVFKWQTVHTFGMYNELILSALLKLSDEILSENILISDVES